mgnify:CR=1 FL=1
MLHDGIMIKLDLFQRKYSQVKLKACHYAIIRAEVKYNYTNLTYVTMIPRVERCFTFPCSRFNLRPIFG